MSEAELQAAVVESARLLGYLVMHIRDSRKSIGVGFPDLVMVQKTTGRVIHAELKSATGRVSAAQQEWLDALRRGGRDVYLWRPADWESGVIRQVLDTGREVAA